MLAIIDILIEINIIMVCLSTSTFKFTQCLLITLYSFIPLSDIKNIAGNRKIFCGNKDKIEKINPDFIDKLPTIADIV